MSFLFCCLFLRFLYLKRLGLFQEKKMVHFFSFLNRKTPQEEEEQEEPQKKKRTACLKNSNGSLLLVSRTALLEELLVSRTARRTACFKNSNGSLLLVSRTALLEELLVSRTACFKNSKKWCFLVLLFKEKIRCCSAVLLFCYSAVFFCCFACFKNSKKSTACFKKRTACFKNSKKRRAFFSCSAVQKRKHRFFEQKNTLSS